MNYLLGCLRGFWKGLICLRSELSQHQSPPPSSSPQDPPAWAPGLLWAAGILLNLVGLSVWLCTLCMAPASLQVYPLCLFALESVWVYI